MNEIAIILGVLCAYASCANVKRYTGTTDRYDYLTPPSRIDNQYRYNQQGTYFDDVAQIPGQATRYPNTYTDHSTSGYRNYDSIGSSMYQPGYTTPRPGGVYSTYGDSYSTPGYGQGYSSYERGLMGPEYGSCVSRPPQNNFVLELLTGMWYGVEVINHLQGDSRVHFSRSCIVVHISDPLDQPPIDNELYHVQHIKAKFRQEFRHLRLLWDEAGGTVEYSLFFRNDSAGHWHVLNAQNGTLASRQDYNQFTGSIQVLKAVHDHLLLYFCQEALPGKAPVQYSVLLSRDPGQIQRYDIEGVHNILQNRQLSLASRRMVCGNSAAHATMSVLISIITCVFACILGW